MRRWIQLVLPFIAVMVLVGGVTFISFYHPRSAPSPPPVAALAWNLAPGGEWEAGASGSYDMGLHNLGEQAIALKLLYQSCSCAHVQAARIDAAAWARWLPSNGPASLLPLWGVPDVSGPVASGLLAGELTWVPLETGDGSRLLVPPGPDGRVCVRLSWLPNRLAEPLVVELGIEMDGVQVQVERRTVPMSFVPSFRIAPDRLDLGEWPAGQAPPTGRLWCWSSTRDKVPVTLAADSELAAECRPPTAGELAQLERTLRNQGITSPIRAAVAVQVQPRPGDLGPLDGTVRLSSPLLAEPLEVPVTGLVRGEVTVGGPDDRDRVHLGLFSASRGIRRKVPLTTGQPDLRLAIDAVTPAYLAAELEPLGPGRWVLTVDVPPDRAVGPLPPGSAVHVRLLGEPARRLCVPITGHGFR